MNLMRSILEIELPMGKVVLLLILFLTVSFAVASDRFELYTKNEVSDNEPEQIGDLQKSSIQKESIQTRFSQLIEEKKQGNSSGNLPQLQSPLVPMGIKLSDENKVIQQEAITAYFHHVIESNEHQRKVFQWQLLSAKLIFAIVTLLVASGIIFAAIQFHHGIRSGRTEDQETEFEASMTGIKISSPVLGIIILTISLVFFYLYLVHVYPIEFVGS